MVPKITEPAEPIETPEPAPAAVEFVEPAPAPPRRGRVYVYDTVSGKKLLYPVPVSWLDGRFPHLKETPSTKEK